MCDCTVCKAVLSNYIQLPNCPFPHLWVSTQSPLSNFFFITPFLSLDHQPAHNSFPYSNLLPSFSFCFSLKKTHLLKFPLMRELMLSSFMAPFCSIFFMVFMVFHSSLASPTNHQVEYKKFSTISAAPALLPGAPLSPLSSSSPTLSPDITPLFPSPRRVPLSPTQSSLPTIPSSPSPPNPDVMAAPGPDFAFPPSGSLPASSSVSVASFQPLKLVAFLILLVVCTMWLSGM